MPEMLAGTANAIVRTAAAAILAAVIFNGLAAADDHAGHDEKGDGSMTKPVAAVAGYTMGTEAVPRSPVSTADFELLKSTVLFSDDDVSALRQSREVLRPHIDEILDTWYGFVGSQPQLLASFSDPRSGEPDGEYLEAVRKRFGQWILDTARADYDQAWLDYQYEIGRRHHRVGKNRTDGADAADHIQFRYVPALFYPVTATLKPFLARGGHPPDEVERMHQAWIKSVLLQTILWSYPYVREGDF